MGRKAETPYNGERVSVEVCVGTGDLAFLRSLGMGNASEGIRRCIKAVVENTLVGEKEGANVGIRD